jgi:hypothetical protein
MRDDPEEMVKSKKRRLKAQDIPPSQKSPPDKRAKDGGVKKN